MAAKKAPPSKVIAADTLTNLVSGMAVVGQDKAASNRYSITLIDQQELENAYRSDWVAGKAVDIPADDSTSEWRTWSATAEQISAIEQVEQQFGVQEKLNSALKKARLYGGGAIVIGVRGQEDASEPLDIERVGQGDLMYLHDVSRHELTAGQIELDVASEYFGQLDLAISYCVYSALVCDHHRHTDKVAIAGNLIANLAG